MLEKLFKKKSEKKGFTGNVNAAHEFRYAMEFARQTLKEETKKEDKVIILDFMLDVIKEDLKNDLLTTIFYSEENFKKRIKLPFPSCFYDEFGGKHELFLPEEKLVRVDLTKDCVLVLPWNRKRMRDSIKNIFASKFKFDKANHKAYYFSPVNICYIYNGSHSIASGVVYKKGYIIAEECDVSRLFNHVYTNGLCWYNSHNNQKLDDLFDFRVGIIYEILKLKYNIEGCP